jgi:hypothetical protein
MSQFMMYMLASWMSTKLMCLSMNVLVDDHEVDVAVARAAG